MYERISEKLVSTERFMLRVFKHVAYVSGIMVLSVFMGAIGFIFIEELALEDAILHSAYILSGFGLVELPQTYTGRLFAALLGLYASLFFLAAFSVIFAPIVHRILHKLHLEEEDSEGSVQSSPKTSA